MKFSRLALAAACGLLLCLGLAACSQSASALIDAIVTAGEAAISVSGLPPAELNYVDVALGLVENLTTAPVSLDTVQGAAAQLATLQLPANPSAVLQSLSKTITAFVNAYQATKTADLTCPSGCLGFAAHAKAKPLKLSAKDGKKLTALHARVAAARAKLSKLRK